MSILLLISRQSSKQGAGVGAGVEVRRISHEGDHIWSKQATQSAGAPARVRGAAHHSRVMFATLAVNVYNVYLADTNVAGCLLSPEATKQYEACRLVRDPGLPCLSTCSSGNGIRKRMTRDAGFPMPLPKIRGNTKLLQSQYVKQVAQSAGAPIKVPEAADIRKVMIAPTTVMMYKGQLSWAKAGQGRGRAGQGGQGRAGQGRAGQGRAGQAGQGRAGQGRAGQGRAGQGRAGQGRAGQGRAGQGRAGPTLDDCPDTLSWPLG
ncbi:TPA: hypothetical protein ACH3X1_004389 [Trebouxia sp. C0004]